MHTGLPEALEHMCKESDGQWVRTREIDGEEHDSKTLGADVVWQDLRNVADEETAPGEIVHGVVEEDHGQDGLASCVVCVV